MGKVRYATRFSYRQAYDWTSLPEGSNLTGKRRKRNEKNEYKSFVVPDSVLLSGHNKNMVEASLDEKQMVSFRGLIEPSNAVQGAGFETPANGTKTDFLQIGDAHTKVLSMNLDKVSGSISLQLDSFARTGQGFRLWSQHDRPERLFDRPGICCSQDRNRDWRHEARAHAPQIPHANQQEARAWLDRRCPVGRSRWQACSRTQDHRRRVPELPKVGRGLARGCEVECLSCLLFLFAGESDVDNRRKKTQRSSWLEQWSSCLRALISGWTPLIWNPK
jgi:hypothetical protein